MRVLFGELHFETHSTEEIIDITGDVLSLVRSWDVKDGVVVVFAPHATAAITMNEAEPGLLQDVMDSISKIAPMNGNYRHNKIDDNAHAHIRSSLLKPFVVFPVRDGTPVLGTWQQILFIESDGPRAQRRVIVEYVGI